MNCTHEEADTKMFVYASHGAEHGTHNILLRTIDPYVVIIGWRKRSVVTVSASHLVLALHSGILTQRLWIKLLAKLNAVAFVHSMP